MLSAALPPDCPVIRKIATARLTSLTKETGIKLKLRYASLDRCFRGGELVSVSTADIKGLLLQSGFKESSLGWLKAGADDAARAIECLRSGTPFLPHGEEKESTEKESSPEERKPLKSRKKFINHGGHGTADALDWEEAMSLVQSLYRDGKYRDSLLIACGCMFGLRVSDLLKLKWGDLQSEDTFTLTEQKTGKRRTVRVNATIRDWAMECRHRLGDEPDGILVFHSAGDNTRPISRQRVDQILKSYASLYKIRTAKVFSSHSLRKTFGRRVYLTENRKGRGEQALLLLCEVFGHSSTAITKRYLGIRREEILSVYDTIAEQ